MSLDAGKIAGGLELDTAKFTQPLRAAAAEATASASKIQESLGRPFASGRDAAGRFTKSVGDVTDSLGKAERASGSLGASLSSVLSIAAGTAVGTIFTSAASAGMSLVGTLGNIAVQGVKLSAQAESTALAIATMIGDADAAKSLLGDLRTFANSTPFEFPELASAAKQLLAMGINAGDVVTTLRMLGDVSSGLGQPVGEMAYLFGQIRSQGRAMTQDLNQFAGRGVPIYAELAKVLKTNELGVRTLAETGQISFERINQAFASMTAAGGKFFNMTVAQSQTAAGLFSTLQDSIGDVQKQIGDALIQGADGNSLLTDLTSEVEKLKPIAVDLGITLASAFRDAFPYIRSVFETAQARVVTLGLIDPSKLYPDAYKTDKSAAVDAAQNNPESAARLGRVQAGISTTAGTADTTLNGMFKGPQLSWTVKLLDAANALHNASDLASKQVTEINGRLAAGQKVTDAEFAALKDRVKQNVSLLSDLQQAMNVALPHYDDATVSKLNVLQSQLRSMQTDSAKAIDEFDKIGREQAEKTKAAKEAGTKGTWAAGSVPTAPRGQGDIGPTTGGAGGGGYDVAGVVGSAAVAQLEAAGKREAADLLKAKQQRDREWKRIEGVYNAGGLSVGDSVDASRAVATEYEVAVKQIRERFAKERESQEKRDDFQRRTSAHSLAATMERIEDYKTKLVIANLKEQDRAFDAEMVAFDAGWKKRIANAVEGEERYTAQLAYEAERREKIRAHEQGEATKQPPADARTPTESTANIPRGRQRRRDRFDKATGEATEHLALRESQGRLTADEAIQLNRLRKQKEITPLQRAVEDAQAGSREREEARLTLGDALRGMRAGVGRMNSSNLAGNYPLPKMPSPLAGLDRRLQQFGTGGGSSNPQPANINVNPAAVFDEKKLAALCVQAITPVINNKLDNLRRELTDRNHSDNVRGGL